VALGNIAASKQLSSLMGERATPSSHVSSCFSILNVVLLFDQSGKVDVPIFAKSPLARTQDQFFESWMVLTAIDLGFKMELEHLLAQPFESISSGFSKVR
jgi:hypothetical protein